MRPCAPQQPISTRSPPLAPAGTSGSRSCNTAWSGGTPRSGQGKHLWSQGGAHFSSKYRPKSGTASRLYGSSSSNETAHISTPLGSFTGVRCRWRSWRECSWSASTHAGRPPSGQPTPHARHASTTRTVTPRAGLSATAPCCQPPGGRLGAHRPPRSADHLDDCWQGADPFPGECFGLKRDSPTQASLSPATARQKPMARSQSSAADAASYSDGRLRSVNRCPRPA